MLAVRERTREFVKRAAIWAARLTQFFDRDNYLGMCIPQTFVRGGTIKRQVCSRYFYEVLNYLLGTHIDSPRLTD